MDRGTFVDTKFYVFSRRLSSGRVGGPVGLYASGTLQKEHTEQSSCLETLLSADGFSESGLKALEHDSVSQELDTDDYGYESDSDLEDAEDDGNDVDYFVQPSPQAISETMDNPTGKSTGPLGMGRTIFVKDVACKTWRALLYYLYTGNACFSRLRSENVGDVDHVSTEARVACSPKSMFRVADKYGFKKLEDLAFYAIRERLSENNIVSELFSAFTPRYDRVPDMEIAFLRDKINSAKV